MYKNDSVRKRTDNVWAICRIFGCRNLPQGDRTAMTPEERERMMYLCQLIQEEQDHAKFMDLILELNDLLARKEHRLETKSKARPN